MKTVSAAELSPLLSYNSPVPVHKNVFSILFFFCHFFPKCEENTSLADCSRYLKMPFSKANLPSNNQTLKGTKESFWITSFLCSTKLTQNGKLRNIDILATRPLRRFSAATLKLLSNLKSDLYLNTLAAPVQLSELKIELLQPKMVINAS